MYMPLEVLPRFMLFFVYLLVLSPIHGHNLGFSPHLETDHPGVAVVTYDNEPPNETASMAGS